MNMTKSVVVPEIKNYLVFRYNLYMIEYMYDYILGRLIEEYPIDKYPLMKKNFGTEKRKFLYVMFGTYRTDYSKYKHSDIEEKPVTKKMRNVFKDYPQFEPFITGEKLIIDHAGEEEYINEHELKLSDKTEAAIRRSVDNAWKLVYDSLEYDNLRGKGIVSELAGWMIIRLTDIYQSEKEKEEKIDNRVLREFEHINMISFDMLDSCDISTLEKVLRKLKEFQGEVSSIYNYKVKKDSRSKKER